MTIVSHDYILQNARMLTPRVKELEFARADGSAIQFTAGQFVTLHIEIDGKKHHRSYSVANAPSAECKTIRIAIAYVANGLASELLFNMTPGSELSLSGPYGLFVLKEEPLKRLVLIATGTGVSPYHAMLPQLSERLAQGLSVALLLGVRTPEELLYGDDFRVMAAKHPNFKFYACYSQETDALKPDEYQGRLHACYPEIQFDAAQDTVYLCGNPHMIDESFQYLTELGFERKQVRREKYAFAK